MQSHNRDIFETDVLKTKTDDALEVKLEKSEKFLKMKLDIF